MSSPPKKEAALRQAAPNETYDMRTVAHGEEQDNFFPPNVEALTAAGLEFHWRKSAADLIGKCPLCRGKLIVHESEPWALCVGAVHCPASTMVFNELLAEIRRAA
jgi:hypothetical protein